MATTNRKRRKLRSERSATEKIREVDREIAVPVRWLKQLIAGFLIPPAWILTRAFFSCFSQATVNHAFWASEEFWFFALGAILWLITFFFSDLQPDYPRFLRRHQRVLGPVTVPSMAFGADWFYLDVSRNVHRLDALERAN